MKRFASLCIAGAVSLFPVVVHADYGQDGLSILCDRNSQTFELNLFVLWNEELDAYDAAHPSGESQNGLRYTKVFSSNRNKRFSRTCQVKDALFHVRIRNDVLSISLNGAPALTRRIYYDWTLRHDHVRGFRWTRESSWQDCSGVAVGIDARDYKCTGATPPNDDAPATTPKTE